MLTHSILYKYIERDNERKREEQSGKRKDKERGGKLNEETNGKQNKTKKFIYQGARAEAESLSKEGLFTRASDLANSDDPFRDHTARDDWITW